MRSLGYLLGGRPRNFDDWEHLVKTRFDGRADFKIEEITKNVERLGIYGIPIERVSTRVGYEVGLEEHLKLKYVLSRHLGVGRKNLGTSEVYVAPTMDSAWGNCIEDALVTGTVLGTRGIEVSIEGKPLSEIYGSLIEQLIMEKFAVAR